MSFEHITIQSRGLKSAIEAIGTANDAIPGQFYLAENTNEYYYGAQNGSLIGPLVAVGGQFINSIADTDSIELINTTGQLTAALRIDAASDNAISASAAGVYSKKYIIHPDSTSFAEIDGDNRIKIKNLLFSSTTVDSTNSTIGDHLTAEGYSDSNFIYEEGDIIILTTNSETWIHNGGTAGTAADFTKVSANVSDSYIRNLLSATDGVDYNSTTGVFSLNTSFTRGLFSGTTPISYNSGTGAFSLATNGISNSLFRQSAGVSVVGRSENSLGNVADIAAGSDGHFLVRRSGALGFGALVAGDITAVGAVTGAVNGVSKVGNNVELGGALTKDTEINGNYLININTESTVLYQNRIFGRKTLITGESISGGNSLGFIRIVKADLNQFVNAINGVKLTIVPIGSSNLQANEEILLQFTLGGATLKNKRISGNTNEIIVGDVQSNVDYILIPIYCTVGAKEYMIIVDQVQIRNVGTFLKNITWQPFTVYTDPLPSINIYKISHSLLLSNNSTNDNTSHLLEVRGEAKIDRLWVGSGVVSTASGVINAQTGFRVNNAASSGTYLRGNGTNFVASALLASDITGTLAINRGGTGLNSLGTALQGIRVNAAGTALEYYTITPPSFTFNNGLTEASGVVKLGGALTANTAIGLDTFNLAFTRSTGKVTFFDSTAGASGFNVKDSDIEINSSNPGTTLHGVILKSPNGNRWRITITNEGAVNTIAL